MERGREGERERRERQKERETEGEKDIYRKKPERRESDLPISIQHFTGECLHGNNINIDYVKILLIASFLGRPHKSRILQAEMQV